MSVRLSTDDWWLIAFGATVVYTAVMYWCMPTRKARLRMFAAPLASTPSPCTGWQGRARLAREPGPTSGSTSPMGEP